MKSSPYDSNQSRDEEEYEGTPRLFFMTSTCIRERRNFAGSTFREDFDIVCSVTLSSGDYKT